MIQLPGDKFDSKATGFVGFGHRFYDYSALCTAASNFLADRDLSSADEFGVESIVHRE